MIDPPVICADLDVSEDSQQLWLDSDDGLL